MHILPRGSKVEGLVVMDAAILYFVVFLIKNLIMNNY